MKDLWALKTRFSRWCVAVLFVGLCAFFGLHGAREYDARMAQTQGASIRMDWDTQDFANEIESKPRFSDTLAWWSGPWMEKVPYYRPLTISLFWAQYQTFGPQGRVGFTWVHRVSHLAFLLLLLGFFASLFGLARATLGVGLFASGLNERLLLPSGTDAFNCWKDQCDVWSAIATVAACWTIWAWSRRNVSRSTSALANDDFWRNRLWWLALAFYLVGLLVKELGMLTPIFMALTLFFAGQLGRNWRALVPFFLFSPLFWCLRFYFLGGWGNKTGSGDAWPTRFLSQVLGWPSSLIAGDGASLAILGAIGIAGALIWWRWRSKNAFPARALAIFGALFALGMVMAYRYLPESLEVMLARFFMGSLPFDTFLVAVFGSGFALMLWHLRRGEKRLFFAWAWVAIGFLPLVVQPPTSPHVHYPLAPGWSLWLVCLAFFAFERARRWLWAAPPSKVSA